MIVSHYLELIYQYRRLFIAMSMGIFIAATAIAVMQLLLSPVYVAMASVTVLPTAAELSYTRRFVSDGDGGSDPAAVMMQTHIENFFSRPVAELTLERLNANAAQEAEQREVSWLAQLFSSLMSGIRTLYDMLNSGTAAQASPHDKAIAAIQSAISVDWVQGSYILRISARADDPETATKLANSVSEAYAERSRRVAGGAAALVRQYIEEEISKPQTRVDPERLSELRRRLMDSELARAAGLGQVRVIDPAIRPLRPTNRVVPMSIGGGVVGMMSAFLIIIMLDIFGRTARTSMDMTRIVGNGFLGRVPLRLALTVRDLPAHWRLPRGAETAFATSVTARIATSRRGAGPLWLHVVGISDHQTAREGGIAIAIALASCDMATDLIVDGEKGEERYRVQRGDGGLRVQRLTNTEPLSSGALVTAGHLLAKKRFPLLTDNRGGRTERREAPAPADEPETVDISPRPIVVVAVAAGQTYEDMLMAMAVERASSGRLFLLIS